MADQKHTDAEIQAALEQYGSQRKTAKALGLNIRSLERRLKRMKKRGAFDKVISAESKTYVVTAAVNATSVHSGFIRALKTYCQHNDAELLVTPMRYKNPTSRDEDQESDEWWHADVTPHLMPHRVRIGNVQVFGDIKIQPTAINPVHSWKTISGQDHAVLGHTKVALDSVPTCHGKDAKLVLTTGACTIENYSDTNAGKKGEFHHQIAAVVLEVDGDRTHIRHVTAESSGAFIDLDLRYSKDGVTQAPRADVLVMGDIHAAEVDRGVLDATKRLCERIHPASIVGHDVLDFGSASHHNRIWERFRRHVQGRGSVLNELKETAAVLDDIASWADQVVLVGSNHHDHFTQWLEKPQNGDDLENAITYHETKAEMLKAIAAGGWIDPFAMWMGRLMKRGGKLKWLSLGESFMRHGIEYSFHGHKGPNGSRGSTRGFATIGAKVVKGHSHGAQIIDGARSVGTSSKMRMGYNEDAPSGWTHTHDITYANGKQTLIHCVGGKFFR